MNIKKKAVGFQKNIKKHGSLLNYNIRAYLFGYWLCCFQTDTM